MVYCGDFGPNALWSINSSNNLATAPISYGLDPNSINYESSIQLQHKILLGKSFYTNIFRQSPTSKHFEACCGDNFQFPWSLRGGRTPIFHNQRLPQHEMFTLKQPTQIQASSLDYMVKLDFPSHPSRDLDFNPINYKSSIQIQHKILSKSFYTNISKQSPTSKHFEVCCGNNCQFPWSFKHYHNHDNKGNSPVVEILMLVVVQSALIKLAEPIVIASVFAGQTLPDSDALWFIKASRDLLSYNDMFSLQHKVTETLIGRESLNEIIYHDYTDSDFADHVEVYCSTPSRTSQFNYHWMAQRINYTKYDSSYVRSANRGQCESIVEKLSQHFFDTIISFLSNESVNSSKNLDT
ncbi:5409_t:CDS:10 [Rhizophagus irregularis]|nr:5409_t:CDS:10 [Rhizophagus irregularis]